MLRVFRIPESKSNPCAMLPTGLQGCSQYAEPCTSHPQNRSPRFSSWPTAGPGKHRAWENPAGQHSAPPQMGRALIISWQEAILLLPQFLSACSYTDFWKKNAAWHIIFSQAAARNQRCDNGIPTKSQPIWACWFAQGEGTQARLFPVLPTKAALPLISQAWRRCSLLLHRGGRISVLLLPLISVPDSLCSPLQRCSPLLFSCQELCHKVLYKRARLREGFSLGMISLILFPTSFYCLWGYDPLEPACIATWKHWLMFSNVLKHLKMFSNTRMKEPRSRNTPSRYQIPSTEISRVSNSEDDSKSVSLHNHHFSVTNLIIPVEGHMPKNTVRVGQGEIKTNNSSWSPLKSRQQSSHAFKVTYKWLQPTKQSKARKPQWSSQQETWPLTSNTSNLVIIASQSTSNFPPDWIY